VHVVSASRRTDIPAFFMPWMIHRVRAGFVMVRNPRNPAHVLRVSLRAGDVAAVVWWSRDYGPLIERLDELDGFGLRGLFQFTLTGYGPPLEPAGPDVSSAADQLATLAARHGPDRVVWRYDPIVIGSVCTRAWHVAHFARLAARLQGATREAVISFVDPYPSTRTALRAIGERTGDTWPAPSLEERVGLARELAAIGADHGMRVRACCESDLVEAGAVQGARCIDAERIRAIAGPDVVLKEAPTRKGCGCVHARDIGAYHTCPRGCAYCYANASPEAGRAGAREVDCRGNHLGPGDLEESLPKRRARSGQLPLAGLEEEVRPRRRT